MKRALLLTLLIISIEIGLSVGIYYLLKQKENNTISANTHTTTTNILNSINEKLAIIDHEMDRSSAFFTLNGKLATPSNYTTALAFNTSPVQDNIESYMWLPKVTFSELKTFDNYLSQNVVPHLFLWQVNTVNNKTKIVPVSPRPYYVPLLLLKPYVKSLAILTGFDFISNNITSIFVTETNQYGNTTVSGRVALIIDSNPFSYGFLISRSTHTSINNQNPNNLIGYVMTITSTIKLIQGALEFIIDPSDMDILVFDITPMVANTRLSLMYKSQTGYDNITLETELSLPQFATRTHFPIFNRVWSINFIFHDDYIQSQRTFVPETVLISMICIFIVLNITFLIIGLYVNSLNEVKDAEHKQRVIANQMLGYVNHEIRNPLNGIVGLIQLSTETLEDITKLGQDKKLSDLDTNIKSIISDLSTANRSCSLLTHIVNDILDIRKLEERKVKLEIVDIPLDRFLIDINRTIIPKLNEKPDVKFNCYTNESKTVIKSDSHRLTQLLLNFLTNAIKFTEKGSVTLNVIKKEKSMRFEVTDTGRGIPEQNKDKNFSDLSNKQPKAMTP